MCDDKVNVQSEKKVFDNLKRKGENDMTFHLTG